MAKQEREVERWITVNGARVPIFKGESKAEVKERIYRKNAGKHETKIRNMDDNWTRKLSRGEKEAMQMEVEKERREVGNPVKSSYGKTHSKLHQHSEIQKMADEHVRKIWTKEGGVANKELYDKAEEWAKKNNVDVKKVKEAAFKAMNEKYADSLKLKKEGKDPLQNIKKESKQSKQINDDFDTKEKQIKQNEAEVNKLNAKDASGNTVSTKGAHNYAKEQNKSMDDLANDIKGNTEAKKAVNEMLNNGVDWDNAVAIAHKQFIGGKKESADKNNAGKKEDFVVGNNPPTSKEQAYMNYKAIKISKYMPKEKQEELKALKAKYYKIWKG